MVGFFEIKTYSIDKKSLLEASEKRLINSGVNWLHATNSILLATLLKAGLKQLMPSGVL